VTGPTPSAPAPVPAAPVQDTTIPAGPAASGGAGDDDMALMMDAQYSVVEEPEGASQPEQAQPAPAPAPAAPAPAPAAQAPPAPGG